MHFLFFLFMKSTVHVFSLCLTGTCPRKHMSIKTSISFILTFLVPWQLRAKSTVFMKAHKVKPQ